MDTVTHLVAGALTPLAFKNAPKSRWLIPFGILCGELPDLDVLAGSSPEALLVVHRGITHALAVQPFSALLMALLFHRVLKQGDASGRWTFAKTWQVAFMALLIHLFLDCMTTFGTRIFLPFSAYRVAIPAMYIIDPVLTLPVLLLLVILLRRGGSAAPAEKRVGLAGKGLAWMLCYPFLALAVGLAAQHALSGRHADPGAPHGVCRVMLTPEPLAPLYWKIIAETEDRYFMGGVFLPGLGGEIAFIPYLRADRELWLRLRREQPLFAVYADFVSFPVQRTEQRADGTTLVEFRDLRYEPTLPGLMKALGRSDGLFLMQAALDREGGLLEYRFLRRGKLADTAWEKALPKREGV
jgi:inner membrane protein